MYNDVRVGWEDRPSRGVDGALIFHQLGLVRWLSRAAEWVRRPRRKEAKRSCVKTFGGPPGTGGSPGSGKEISSSIRLVRPIYLGLHDAPDDSYDGVHITTTLDPRPETSP